MADIVLDGIGRVSSVGSLVAASMETAGHYTQSQLLDVFAGPFGMHLGALLYLIAIIISLVSLASGGSYRFGIWLLIGPPLFFFLVNVRTPSDGVQWRFGARDHDQSEVLRGVRGLTGQNGSSGNISLFFSTWDKLVSGVVQGFVELLHLTDKGSDLDFLNKTETYMRLFGKDVQDPRVKGFVGLALSNRCADFIALKKKVSNPQTPQNQKDAAQRLLDNHGGNNWVLSVDEKEEPWLGEWLHSVYGDNIAKQYTCQQVWDLAVKIFRSIATNYIDELVRLDKPLGLDPQLAREKLAWKFETQSGNGFVVKDVASSGVNAEDAALTMAINELTARLLFRTLSEVNPELVALAVDEHPQIAGEGGREMDEGTARSIRELHSTEDYQYKGELIVSALTLPYIQGCVLYFLAVTFPFFAICLIIPGRHHGFLLWMGLWLWAKLWDFGFGVVMMIDNMLYALMPHGPPITQADLGDPGRAFKNLLEVDPAYSVATYYNLVAVCMLSIPIITGLLVHKGGHEVIQTVGATFRDFPNKYGTSMAAYKRAMAAQHNAGKARRYEDMVVRNNAVRVLQSDGELQAAYSRLAFLEALKANKGNIDELIKKAGDKLPPFLGRALSPEMRANLTGFGWLRDGVTTLGKDVSGKALDALIERQRLLANSMYTRDLQMLGYKASKSDYALEMAGEAILNRFNSHHFVRQFPWKAELDVMNAERYFPFGGVADRGVQDLFNAVMGKRN
jgi:hypothetical protein